MFNERARRIFAARIFAAAKTSLAAAGLALAAACASDPAPGPVVSEAPRPSAPPTVDRAPREPEFEVDRRRFIEPLHLRDEEPVRVGLLLPFSASSEAAERIAASMFDAAQLAAFQGGDQRFLLIPKDTRGTPDGAAQAAKSALSDGAEIILGPLFAGSVDAVADVAVPFGAPVIAFSSDQKSTRPGVYLLSFPPEAEVKRITEYAVENGLVRFGLIAPENEYGSRVSNAFSSAVYGQGGVVVHEERYIQDVTAMREPAKRLAQYSKEIIPVELRHNYDPTKPQAGEGGFARGYQAVLIPERGTLLRALAPLFPYYNVNIQEVKLLGVSAWNNPRLTREPALQGGWFAAPDPEIKGAFEARFEETFGEKPHRLASLSYDATLLVAKLAQNPRKDRFSAAAIANPQGFFGADGLFRLREDGTVERGLAILEIRSNGIEVIEPAPRSFAPAF
ncbi:MAG: penicillin-binding protein activator [Parvularculaceae bacterium]